MRRLRRLKHPLTIAYLIVISGLLFYAYRLESLARDTNHILNVEVQEKDAQIAAQQYIIEKQAVPAIVYMTRAMREGGLTPPDVLLHPNEPPFNPPPKENQ